MMVAHGILTDKRLYFAAAVLSTSAMQLILKYERETGKKMEGELK